jgi:hypothetical protein
MRSGDGSIKREPEFVLVNRLMIPKLARIEVKAKGSPLPNGSFLHPPRPEGSTIRLNPDSAIETQSARAGE